MKRLDGRVALVTGAASGIGKATAASRRRGAAVMVTDVNEALEATRPTGSRAAGATVDYLHLDVVSETGLGGCRRQAVERSARSTCSSTTPACRASCTPIEDTTLADWERQIAIVQPGVFLA